jgi:ABC-2 type transport system ATP-binding protein
MVSASIGAEPLRIEGLVKRYGRVQAVRGIDLAVRAGEVFGFVGPNGAGKSTTIRCILDLLHPTAGQIRVFGRDPHRDGPRLRESVAYVPGELRLPERLSGRQFLSSIGRLRSHFDRNRLDDLAERFKLDLDRSIRHLSSGNRRKVSVLSAFLSDAALLILDEPTSGLDPLMQHEFLGLVRERRAAGDTVFLSSHILSEVQSVADRLAVLRAGKIVAQGTVNEVRGLARQRVEVWFESAVPPMVATVPGIADPVIEGRQFRAVLTGSARPLIDALAGQPIESVLIQEPDLEEAFLGLYEEDDGSAADVSGGPARGPSATR